MSKTKTLVPVKKEDKKPPDGKASAPLKRRIPTIAFSKKNQPPPANAFAARLPLPLGKRFEATRTFLLKQKGVVEDVYYYGPRSGWALRYLLDSRPLCSLHVHDDKPMGLLSLEAAVAGTVAWQALSSVGQKARRQAHGSPSLLWLDVPCEGTGAADLKILLKIKLTWLRQTTSSQTSAPCADSTFET